MIRGIIKYGSFHSKIIVYEKRFKMKKFPNESCLTHAESIYLCVVILYFG